ncbi:hemolysin A [Thalassoporum mexicanum PCC 7367]|uniref:TlyA family RNA methyltransferase n=1 Tax=Thalassoporum mexicanum TaxID=3457544 RepID=UPI00029FCD31|nr:TlyA family RNA methyltransferase [Pseudanabaena sp. PCC 7367]AFY69784.1 hemolysin A [Pseudanabaena sp. PCC 7367]
MKKRLDVLLVDLKLVPSREQAQRYIRAGWVQVNQTVIDKPGTAIATDADILVKQRSPYVSRGGEKLAGALQEFKIKVSDRICLDGGISTGGFTDCLLQNRAVRVYGVDVGYGQVAWKIQSDERVVIRERTNLRHLSADQLYQANQPIADLAVLDLSFISLTKVLPNLWQLLRSPREAVLLVKPQFEAGKAQVGKNGIVRDPQVRAEAIDRVIKAATEIGWQFKGITPAAIAGRTGNQEYLLWLAEGQGEMRSTPELAEIERITSVQ